jgi:hypothetical protein
MLAAFASIVYAVSAAVWMGQPYPRVRHRNIGAAWAAPKEGRRSSVSEVQDSERELPMNVRFSPGSKCQAQNCVG